MGKEIKNYSELCRVCKSVGLWYVGSFMIEFIIKKHLWENPETKHQFITYMLGEYDFGDSLSSTRTRINGMIRIVESRMVEKALEMVINANKIKLGCEESRVNAEYCLELLDSGKLTY